MRERRSAPRNREEGGRGHSGEEALLTCGVVPRAKRRERKEKEKREEESVDKVGAVYRFQVNIREEEETDSLLTGEGSKGGERGVVGSTQERERKPKKKRGQAGSLRRLWRLNPSHLRSLAVRVCVYDRDRYCIGSSEYRLLVLTREAARKRESVTFHCGKGGGGREGGKERKAAKRLREC